MPCAKLASSTGISGIFSNGGYFMRTLGALFLIVWAAAAQESRGTIAGRVTDAQDAGIPHARVIITNIDTGVNTRVESNDHGAYVAPLLLPGNYRVAAEHPGFKHTTRGGIVLGV